MCWLPSDIFPEMGSLTEKAVPFLIFRGISILFSTVAAPICIHTNSAWGFPFLHILISTCFFLDLLMMAILTGVRWYLIEDLIWSSLMISDVEHSLICLQALYMSSLDKCLFRSFAHILIGLFVLLGLNCINSLYILEIKPLSDVSLVKCSPIQWVPCLFCWSFL